MWSLRRLLALLVTINLIAFTNGGPLGPLPNVTSADMGLKEGSCSMGDVVYLPGDEFPGASPCERCRCEARGLRCEPLQCQPRPGCKALHRPDHCCPTYQCECEQEGRVYGNGEKLVDPRDPCRVCYCQGGEVVCRRIACFVRDDCRPRTVPGRCCPEYDDCPIRGVTSLPGVTAVPSASPAVVVEPSDVPTPPKEVKQEITIKEITPVSEIPIITDVKIKEILPSPSIEVSEYSSSKSPLITREATSEKSINTESTKTETGGASVVEVKSSSEIAPKEVKNTKDESTQVDDNPPSKISLSTQDSINSEIYPSNVPVIATMGGPVPFPSVNQDAVSTKAPVIYEEDPSFSDHNPAFPPLPDDLSVLSNHGDEIVPEPSADTDHIINEHISTPELVISSAPPRRQQDDNFLKFEYTSTDSAQPSEITTEKSPATFTETSTALYETTTTTQGPNVKDSPLLNLRSAIPTEILSAPSEVIITDDLSTSAPSDQSTTTVTITTAAPNKDIEIFSTEESVKPKKLEELSTVQDPWMSTKFEETATENLHSDAPTASEEVSTDEPDTPLDRVSFVPPSELSFDTTTSTKSSDTGSSATPQVQTTSSIAKSNVATEVTSQTELSSLPIETSDQNPHEASENVSKHTPITTEGPLTTIDKTAPSSVETITVSKSNQKGNIDNVETTEFMLTFGSSESSTDTVEMIKIAGDSEKNAAIIDNDHNKNALTDLIKLVSDVASISEHTDAPANAFPALPTTISDSEELIPVNAGYKSKNNNNNQNSITEMPFKSKSGSQANKQKIVEIEDDEVSGITDAAPPNDKVEPTTRRPIIDNVSDDMPPTNTDKKDIEIITQSYVPTINKRPTKVVLKEDTPPENSPDSASTVAPAALTSAVTQGAPATAPAASLTTPGAAQ